MTSMVETLAAKAILVRPSFKVLSTTRTDKEVTQEVNEQHNAGHEAGRYVASLFPKQALAPVRSVVNETRSWINHMTMPFVVEGHRLLITGRVPTFKHEFSNMNQRFEVAVAEFLLDWPAHMAEAKRIRNGMFKAEDYPTEEQARSMFKMSVDYLPVPTGDTAVRMLDSVTADSIKESIDKATSDAFDHAHSSLWRRLYDSTKHLASVCANYKSGENGEIRKFHDSVITGLRETCDMLEEMNIKGCGMLAGFVEQVRRDLAAHESDELKESRVLRQDISDRASEVLTMMERYL